MEANRLSCGVQLVCAYVEPAEPVIVVDFLAAWPRQLGTLRIRWDDERGPALLERLEQWVTAQTPVWLVHTADAVTVTSRSHSVERLVLEH